MSKFTEPERAVVIEENPLVLIPHEIMTGRWLTS